MRWEKPVPVHSRRYVGIRYPGIFLILFLSACSLETTPRVAVRYTVSINNPAERLFRVKMELPAKAGAIRLALPSTRPGDPTLNNNARFLLKFQAADSGSRALDVRRIEKQTWIVKVPQGGIVTVTYEIKVNERDVLRLATNGLADNGGFIDGSSVFLYSKDIELLPTKVRLELPPSWRIAAAIPGRDGWFCAGSYKELIDSPFEFGSPAERSITVSGIPFRFIFDAPLPHYDQQKFDENARRIIQTLLSLFPSAPFDQYMVLFHWRPDLDFGGGIEHGQCMVMNIGKQWMLDLPINYAGTFAHELFHAWNAEKIHPAEFDHWDNSRENYTRLMWFVEGVTNYYATLILIRSGVLPKDSFYRMLGNTISAFENENGRGFLSLADAAVAEWIRPVESLDYYSGGEVMGFLLDLKIRAATRNRHSLDDVMRALYERSRNPGYDGFTEEDLIRTINETGNQNVRSLFDSQINGRLHIEYNRILKPFGLAVESHEEGGKKVFVLKMKDGLSSEQEQWLASLLSPL